MIRKREPLKTIKKFKNKLKFSSLFPLKPVVRSLLCTPPPSLVPHLRNGRKATATPRCQEGEVLRWSMCVWWGPLPQGG